MRLGDGCAQEIRIINELETDVLTKALTVCYHIGVGRMSREKTVKSKTIYATVQQPLDPPSASMGVGGEGSSSGVLEVMVKSEAKKSIVVYVVRCVC